MGFEKEIKDLKDRVEKLEKKVRYLESDVDDLKK